jgi:hypothetical protein
MAVSVPSRLLQFDECDSRESLIDAASRLARELLSHNASRLRHSAAVAERAASFCGSVDAQDRGTSSRPQQSVAPQKVPLLAGPR